MQFRITGGLHTARYVFLDLLSGIARRLTDLTVMTSIFNQDETRVQTRSLSRRSDGQHRSRSWDARASTRFLLGSQQNNAVD